MAKGRIFVVAAQLLKSLEAKNGKLLQVHEGGDVSWRREKKGHIKQN